jgi:effector-binding domain-containing protein
MTIKDTKPFNALFFSTHTTLPQLGEHVGHVAKEIYREAARLDIMPTGPIQWNYYGIDGKPETVFKLEIVLPIQEKNVEARVFEWKQIPSFKCVSLLHEGKWENLPEVYDKAISHICDSGFTITTECRERYIVMDFENGENNVTEIQIGIQ